MIPVAQLSNRELLAEVKSLAARERDATAALVASLAELDERRLYLGEGYSSLFTYCTQVLHLSEHAAYGRIEAARAARRFPLILDLLPDGAITLTTICLLASQLTAENYAEVLESARYKSRREVEHLVSALRPQPAVPSSVRKLPTAPASEIPCLRPQVSESGRLEPRPEAVSDSVDIQPRRPAVVTPLSPAQYKVQITVSADTYEKLRRAQDLLRHTIPDGDPAVIFDRAVASVGSSVSTAGAASVDSLNFIMWSRMPPVVLLPWRIFSFVAGRITRTRASSTSGRCGFGRDLMWMAGPFQLGSDRVDGPRSYQIAARARTAWADLIDKSVYDRWYP